MQFLNQRMIFCRYCETDSEIYMKDKEIRINKFGGKKRIPMFKTFCVSPAVKRVVLVKGETGRSMDRKE